MKQKVNIKKYHLKYFIHYIYTHMVIYTLDYFQVIKILHYYKGGWCIKKMGGGAGVQVRWLKNARGADIWVEKDGKELKKQKDLGYCQFPMAIKIYESEV